MGPFPASMQALVLCGSFVQQHALRHSLFSIIQHAQNNSFEVSSNSMPTLKRYQYKIPLAEKKPPPQNNSPFLAYHPLGNISDFITHNTGSHVACLRLASSPTQYPPLASSAAQLRTLLTFSTLRQPAHFRPLHFPTILHKSSTSTSQTVSTPIAHRTFPFTPPSYPCSSPVPSLAPSNPSFPTTMTPFSTNQTQTLTPFAKHIYSTHVLSMASSPILHTTSAPLPLVPHS